MIEVKNLTKKYGDCVALADISFKIRNGITCGIYGPDRAGKSTLMNAITGCLAPSSGEININGYDISAHPLQAKGLIGYLPEDPPLYTDMTVSEYLTFIAEAKKLSYDKIFAHIRSVMEQTGIYELRDKLICNLPDSDRRKTGIAQAMLAKPEIILLDEPTAGLDTAQTVEIRNIIRRLGERKTVIISTCKASEIIAVCDRVISLDKGNILFDEDIRSFEKRSAAENSDTSDVEKDAAQSKEENGEG